MNHRLEKPPANRVDMTVIGINPDTVLDTVRLEALAQAEVIYTSPRHRDLIIKQCPDLPCLWQMWQSPLEQSLNRIKEDHEAGKKLVIIASGDPMCHGIGATLNRYFTDCKLRILPAPSSFCLAAARLQWAYEDTLQISLHRGADTQVLSYLTQKKNLICLTKNKHSPKNIADILLQHGWGGSKLTVLEELGSNTECIRTFTAQELANKKLEFQNLNIVAIEPFSTEKNLAKHKTFPTDDDLIHDGQLTKFAFRAITLATLNPSPNAQLWDVGAGSGAISLAWMKLGGRAIAIEKSPKRCAIIRQNTDFYNMPLFQLCEGNAEEILEHLHKNNPAPEAIFFGAALPLIQEAMSMLQQGGILVANAVTLPSQQIVTELRLKHGGHIRRINIEEEESIAHLVALKPARSVLQYWWHKS